MAERTLALFTMATAIAGLVGAVVNAIVQVIHCRHDKREFAKRRVDQ